MAVSKKKVKQSKEPKGNSVGQGGNPEQYYSEHPSWNFSSCDTEQWSLYDEQSKEIFWQEILPHLVSWEQQKWSEILIESKKQNHSIEVDCLNKLATDRLVDLYVEAEALISLRLTGKHRLYGYIEKAVFHVLWADLDHGDNNTCVCRSYKKHT